MSIPEHTHQRYCQVNNKHMRILPSGEHVFQRDLPDPYNDNEFYAWFVRTQPSNVSARKTRARTKQKHYSQFI